MTKRGHVQRLKILDTAAALFDSRGYHNVSVDDIAAAVGLAKPTLYHYFEGKAQILYEIHRQFIAPLLETARERGASGIPAAEELRLMLRDAIVVFAKRPGQMRVFAENLRDLDPEHRQEVLASRDAYRQMVQRTVERGAANGEFKVGNPAVAALMYLGAVNWVYNWYDPDGPLSADEMAEEMWRQVHFGLVGPRVEAGW